MDNQQVLEIFMGRGMVDKYLAQDIEATMEASGKSMAETLSDFDVITSKDEVWPVIASELSAELIDLNNFVPTNEVLALIPAGTARLHGALPVAMAPDGLHVVLSDPLNPQTAEDLRFALGLEVIVAVAPDYLIEEKIDEFYGGEGSSTADLLDQMDVSLNADGTEDVASGNAGVDELSDADTLVAPKIGGAVPLSLDVMGCVEVVACTIVISSLEARAALEASIPMVVLGVLVVTRPICDREQE